MTVSKLIEELQKMDKDKIVVIAEPDGIGWDNVGKVIDSEFAVKITMDGNTLFDND